MAWASIIALSAIVPNAVAAQEPRVTSSNFAPEMFTLFCLNPQANVVKTSAAIEGAIKRKMAVQMNTASANKIFGEGRAKIAWVLSPPQGGKPTFLAVIHDKECEVDTLASFNTTLTDVKASLNHYASENQGQFIENSADFLRDSGQLGNAFTLKQADGDIYMIVTRNSDVSIDAESQIRMMALTH